MKVLVVEDDIIIRSLLKVKIKRLFRDNQETFVVEGAEKMSTARKMAVSFAPHVIILDLSLLDSSDKETISSIPELSETGAVIVVSCNLDRNIIADCYAAGAYDVIDKEVVSSSLLKDKILNAYRTKTERPAASGSPPLVG